MAEVIYLRADQQPPDADVWVRIWRSDRNKFQVQVYEDRADKMTFKYVSDRLDSFAAALSEATQHADAIEVAMVFAIDCPGERASP